MIIGETTNVNKIILLSRDKKGNRIIEEKDFQNYFYVHSDESHNIEGSENTSITDIYGKHKLTKISYPEYKIPQSHISHFSKVYESDIDVVTKYLKDEFEDIEYTPITVEYIDIETNSDLIMPTVEGVEDEITAISTYNNIDKKLRTFTWSDNVGNISDDVFIYRSEKEMLNAYLDYMENNDCDVITGWNVINFDLLYILNRLTKLRIDFSRLSPLRSVNFDLTSKRVKIYGRVCIDMLEMYKKLHFSQLESFKLNNVAELELGEKKIDYEGSLYDLRINDFYKFIEYNRKDVMLVHAIDEKNQIIKQFDNIHRMCKCSFEMVLYNSVVIESFLLTYAKNKFALPNKQFKVKQKYDGAQVFAPIGGLYEDVSVFDFKSLYPKIDSLINGSPETVIHSIGDNCIHLKIPSIITLPDSISNAEKGRIQSEFQKYFENEWDVETQTFRNPAPNKIHGYIQIEDIIFTKEKKGVIPEILEYLYDKRVLMQQERDKFEYGTEEYSMNESKQYAFKVVLNSFYGVLGDEMFRLYDPRVAKAITYMGKCVILWSKTIAQKYGYKVIYGDTDSIFVNISIEESNKLKNLIQNSLDEFIKYFNISEQHLLLDYEKSYKKLFFTNAKKRYAGLLCFYKGKHIESKLQIVGFSAVRSDQSLLAKKVQRTVLEMLLKQNHPELVVGDYLKDVIKQIKNNQCKVEDISIPTILSKPTYEYKSINPIVRGVVFSNSHILSNPIMPGEKILLLYCSVDGYTKCDVIAFRTAFDLRNIKYQININEHIKESVIAKVTDIYEIMNWNIGILTGQKNLNMFF